MVVEPTCSDQEECSA